MLSSSSFPSINMKYNSKIESKLSTNLIKDKEIIYNQEHNTTPHLSSNENIEIILKDNQ